MCGRLALYLSERELLDEFAIAEIAGDARLLPPSYNLGPMQTALVVLPGRDDVAALRLETARWGLVPGWAKDPAIGAKMFNARSETVAEKPSFRAAYARRRCVVPANGYYEWQARPSGKQPYFIHPADGRPAGFAGLYEYWGEGDDRLRTFTIVTTAAKGALAAVHERQPVMLTRDAREAWLDPTTEGAELAAVLASNPPETALHPVSRDVGNIRNNRPDLVEPVDT